METRDCQAEYLRWCQNARDADTAKALSEMRGHPQQIQDCFYRDLSFGTGGLRGTMGPGTNRINVYTIAQATRGVAGYLSSHFDQHQRKVAICWDTRIHSQTFAQLSAGIFAGLGAQVLLFPRPIPTPFLSFAVRKLECACGVMITASHNPACDNGYKVYQHMGCQITNADAEEISRQIRQWDVLEPWKETDFQQGISQGRIGYMDEELLTDYLQEVQKQSVLFGDALNRRFPIVYSPLHGTGLEPVLRTLEQSGFSAVTVVPQQRDPDGRFPTCPNPNPELPQAMALAISCGEKSGAGLVLATDPDCDRVAIAVRERGGAMRLLSGNQTGVLLLDYICSQRKKHGRMPKNPVFLHTIVTTGMAREIARHYGVAAIQVLTGFKYIGEQISRLETQGRSDDFIFGLEESCGYLSGSYVRDKDGVNGALLLCEMYGYYLSRCTTPSERLEQLYQEYGYWLDSQYSHPFTGMAGAQKIPQIMAQLRRHTDAIGTEKIRQLLDYAQGLDGLPPSDVLKFQLEKDGWVTIRPSGTEPKLKVYLSLQGTNWETALRRQQQVEEQLKRYLSQFL